MVCLAAAPSFAASRTAGEPSFKLTQLDVHMGSPSERENREPHRGRPRVECRVVTVRERHGDQIVVRNIRRCD